MANKSVFVDGGLKLSFNEYSLRMESMKSCSDFIIILSLI